MKCPECGSKKITNENTGQCKGHRRIGGAFHNVCECGCEFITEAGSYRVTKHAKGGSGPFKGGPVK